MPEFKYYAVCWVLLTTHDIEIAMPPTVYALALVSDSVGCKWMLC